MKQNSRRWQVRTELWELLLYGKDTIRNFGKVQNLLEFVEP